MKLEKIDYFQPLIVVIAILAFLLMGYIGSFNYRFEVPLNAEVTLTIIFACIIFAARALIVKYKVNVEDTKEISFLSEKLILE